MKAGDDNFRLLVIDQGNRKCKLTCFRGAEVTGSDTVDGMLTIEAAAEAAERFSPQAAVYCSVAKVDVRLVESLRLLFGDEALLVVTHHTPVPLHTAYTTPETLGLDRLAAAVGVWYDYLGKSALVIDAGTAITEDWLTAEGCFAGGRISPGIGLRFKALHAFTGRLPLLEGANEAPWIGTDTALSMMSGVINGVKGELLQMISEAPAMPEVVMITGGDARIIENMLKDSGLPIMTDANLLAKGLRRIYIYNEDNN